MIQFKKMASNLTELTQGDITYYYSYETCVAFYTKKDGLITSKNIWSKTTGKHLNIIKGNYTTKKEVPNDEFKNILKNLEQ